MGDEDVASREILRRWLAKAQAEGGVPDEVLQKRARVRTSWSALIEVRDRREERIRGRIFNVSEDGLGIQCRTKIPEWAEVRIHLRGEPDEVLNGVVVHCTETVGGFKIGIRPK